MGASVFAQHHLVTDTKAPAVLSGIVWTDVIGELFVQVGMNESLRAYLGPSGMYACVPRCLQMDRIREEVSPEP